MTSMNKVTDRARRYAWPLASLTTLAIFEVALIIWRVAVRWG